MENRFFTGRVITLPRDRRSLVNDVQVVEGTYFSSNSTNEILVEKAFADYHGLKSGDKLLLTYSENDFEFIIVGTVVSPEYLWPAKNLKDHMPTVLRSWGVFFLREDEGLRILGANDQINEIAVTTVNQNTRDSVINHVKNALEPYGIAEVVKREDQPSDKILHLMVGTLDVLAPVFSVFFLAVAASSTYVLLTRMVSSQNMQIGTLRALGYGKRSILAYYLSFVLVIWVISALAGIVLGQIASAYLTNLLPLKSVCQLFIPIFN